MDFLRYIGDLINNNPGKALGVFLGLLLGILLFTIGFWTTVLILALMSVGFLIGKSRDDKVPLIDTLTGLFKRKDDSND